MADFSKALAKILKWEGGWSDNPKDSGGATMKGITLETYRSVYGRGKTKLDLKNITQEQVEWIYRKLYWNKMNGDYIKNQSLAELIFDLIVNSGVGKLKECQKVTGALPDGIIGTKTIELWNRTPKDCFSSIWNYRKQYYIKIGVGKNAVFLKGWLNRLNSYEYQ